MKILIVCDIFPPEFAPRMGYLCKYLARMGCMADVICEEYSDDRRFDFLSDTAHHIKRVRFYRSSKVPKPKAEWGWLLFRDLFFHYKDHRFISEIQKDKYFSGYDLILCSTFRTFPLRAAEKLARHFKVPLVADLRDIVEQYPDHSYIGHHLPFSRMANKWFTRHLLNERNRVLAKAAAVVSVSPWHVDFLKTFNPNTYLIYNGYDPELFFPAPRKDPFFRIVYTGRIVSMAISNPELLFKAVAGLIRTGRVDRTDFRIDWYCDPTTREYVLQLAREYGLTDITECFAFLPATDIPALLNQASILLLLVNTSAQNGPKGIMTTKFFEYLAVGKPLLLIPDDRSHLSGIIKEYHCGLSAQNEKDAAQFIEEQYKEWKINACTQVEVQSGIESLFSRKRQAGQFLELFKNILRHE